MKVQPAATPATAAGPGDNAERVLSVVMPCYNEADLVLRSVERVMEQPFVRELVIVDDGSTDGTWEAMSTISDPRIRVLRHDVNRGKGAALRTGLAEARGPFVAVHDADLEYDPAELGKLLRPLLAGDADVVYGSRFLTTEARRVLYFWHSLGNKSLTLFSNMMTNLNLTDMETCYKVFRRDVLDRIVIEEDRFGVEPELTAKVAALNVRVFEIGISYHGRSYDEGKKIGWRDGARAIVAITKYSRSARTAQRRLRRRPSEFDEADAELADTLETLDNAQNYAQWISEQFVEHVRGRVLEVGAGHGTFSSALADRASELVITDPSERAVGILRERFAGRPGITIEVADLDAAVEQGPFDTIVLVNVLEHVRDDEKALLKLSEALTPAGNLCIFVPAFELLYSTFDRQVGHHRRYRTRTLEKRLATAGLRTVDTHYVNAVGFFAWLVTARIAGATPTNPRLVRPYDRAVVPVLRAVESRVRPPIGQSLVSISRRT